MEATITVTIDLSKSFYAKVSDEYRIYIPTEFRRTSNIKPGDIVWVIIGTIIPKDDRRVIIP